MSHEEMSFCELKNKEIVNEIDGRRLGKTCDLIFSPHDGCVLGIVAPFNKRGLFFKGQEVFIPFKHICKIGPDVILVRLTSELSQPDACVNMERNERPGRFDARKAAARDSHQPRHGGRHADADRREYYYDDDDDRMDPRPDIPPAGRQERPFEEGAPSADCDFRCEKCMLFDCNKRWKGAPRQKKRPHRASLDEGSAYVDGKLYEANER